MGQTERHTSLGVMGLTGLKHPKFWDLTISRPTVWSTPSPVPTKVPSPLVVTSPQVLTASRPAVAPASHRPAEDSSHRAWGPALGLEV